MSLSESIKNRDMAELVKTVDKAVKIYGADAPAPLPVETVHGALPFTAVFDEETKWSVITGAYAEIVQASARIPEGAPKKVEIAKLIATNPVLRNLTKTTAASDDGLL
jgi:hypothetical protein